MKQSRTSICVLFCYLMLTLTSLSLARGDDVRTRQEFQPFGSEASSPEQSKAEICGFPPDRSKPQGECYMLVPQKFYGEPQLLHAVRSLSDIFPIWHPGISSIPLNALGEEVQTRFLSEMGDDIFVNDRTHGMRYLSLLNIELFVKSRTQPEIQRGFQHKVGAPLDWWVKPKLPQEISLVVSIESDELHFARSRNVYIKMQLEEPDSNVYIISNPATAYDDFANLFESVQSHEPRRLRFHRIEGFKSEYYSEHLISNLKRYVRDVGSVLELDSARYVIRVGSFPVEFGDEELINYLWTPKVHDTNRQQVLSTLEEYARTRSSGFYQ